MNTIERDGQSEIVFDNERLWNGVIIPNDFPQSIINIIESENEEAKSLYELDMELGC